jgi:hypothetical protein
MKTSMFLIAALIGAVPMGMTPAAPLPSAALPLPAPTATDVGDADSFGHGVVFLGQIQTLPVGLHSSCVGNDQTRQRCVTLVPNGQTSFAESDLGVIRLPARATRTLLCTNAMLFLNTESANDDSSPAMQSLSFTADVTVENPVLDDPSLINPRTGTAFNGTLQIGVVGFFERHTMAAGAFEQSNDGKAAVCTAGLRKSVLMQVYGLSDALATQFFRRPMVVHFGANGATELVDGAQLFYSVRLYGDE